MTVAIGTICVHRLLLVDIISAMARASNRLIGQDMHLSQEMSILTDELVEYVRKSDKARVYNDRARLGGNIDDPAPVQQPDPVPAGGGVDPVDGGGEPPTGGVLGGGEPAGVRSDLPVDVGVDVEEGEVV